jgi:four helix bundle protein
LAAFDSDERCDLQADGQLPQGRDLRLEQSLWRAGVSVASNIAEGYARNSTGEYKQFLGMARGSNSEVQTQFVIARELGFGSPQLLDIAEGLSNEVGKMMAAILRNL